MRAHLDGHGNHREEDRNSSFDIGGSLEVPGESPAEATKSEGSEEKNSPMANPPVDPPDEDRSVMVRIFLAMSDAAEKRDWGEAQKQFKEGLRLINEGKASSVPVSAVEWESFYYRELFTSGDGSGLDKLKDLASANPTIPRRQRVSHDVTRVMIAMKMLRNGGNARRRKTREMTRQRACLTPPAS